MEKSKSPIICVVGTTATGKSALGIKAALEFNGEIICADSRTVYKELSIGTAKPSLEDQKRVPHHGIDLVAPNQNFSAADFKDYAKQMVAEVQSRHKLPILVGGSGLYIDGYVYDFSFAEVPSSELRKQIESKTLLQLQQQAIELGIDETSTSWQNPRHLARLIERTMSGQGAPEKRVKPANVLLIGLQIPREQLIERVERRVDTMFNNGLVEEAAAAFKKYGSGASGLSAPAYKALAEYFNGNINLQEARQRFIQNDSQLARRQRTWFKRNPDIVWCTTEDEALKNIRAFIA